MWGEGRKIEAVQYLSSGSKRTFLTALKLWPLLSLDSRHASMLADRSLAWSTFQYIIAWFCYKVFSWETTSVQEEFLWLRNSFLPLDLHQPFGITLDIVYQELYADSLYSIITRSTTDDRIPFTGESYFYVPRPNNGASPVANIICTGDPSLGQGMGFTTHRIYGDV
jgi:hypothetical protein